MAEGDEGLSARDRRAQRVREQTRRDLPKKAAKVAAVVLVAFLIIAGAVWAFNAFKPPKEVHHHVGIVMFADGERINFDHRAFDLSTTQYLRAHLHVPSDPDWVLHVEGLPGVTLNRFFESVQIQTSDDAVTLHPVIHGGRVFQNNETHEWKVFVDTCADGPDNWADEADKFDYVPGQHDRVLMTFAPRDATIDDLSDQAAQVPTDQQIGEEGNDRCEGGAQVGAGHTTESLILDDGRRVARPW